MSILFQYQVQLQFVNDSGSYKTRGLQVQHIPTGEERMICHLQYTDWPDHGCPEDIHGFLGTEILSYLKHLSQIFCL